MSSSSSLAASTDLTDMHRFLTSTKKNQVLPHMPVDRRQFVTGVCANALL